jgi:hypothetical protein
MQINGYEDVNQDLMNIRVLQAGSSMDGTVFGTDSTSNWQFGDNFNFNNSSHTSNHADFIGANTTLNGAAGTNGSASFDMNAELSGFGAWANSFNLSWPSLDANNPPAFGTSDFDTGLPPHFSNNMPSGHGGSGLGSNLPYDFNAGLPSGLGGFGSGGNASSDSDNGMRSSFGNGMPSALSNGMRLSFNNGMPSSFGNGIPSGFDDGLGSGRGNDMLSGFSLDVPSRPRTGFQGRSNAFITGRPSGQGNGIPSSVVTGLLGLPNAFATAAATPSRGSIDPLEDTYQDDSRDLYLASPTRPCRTQNLLGGSGSCSNAGSGVRASYHPNHFPRPSHFPGLNHLSSATPRDQSQSYGQFGTNTPSPSYGMNISSLSSTPNTSGWNSQTNDWAQESNSQYTTPGGAIDPRDLQLQPNGTGAGGYVAPGDMQLSTSCSVTRTLTDGSGSNEGSIAGALSRVQDGTGRTGRPPYRPSSTILGQDNGSTRVPTDSTGHGSGEDLVFGTGNPFADEDEYTFAEPPRRRTARNTGTSQGADRDTDDEDDFHDYPTETRLGFLTAPRPHPRTPDSSDDTLDDVFVPGKGESDDDYEPETPAKASKNSKKSVKPTPASKKSTKATPKKDVTRTKPTKKVNVTNPVPTTPSSGRRMRAPRPKLMKPDEDFWQRCCLSFEYEWRMRHGAIPYGELAEHVDPVCTGNALQQALWKLRRRRVAANLRVPPAPYTRRTSSHRGAPAAPSSRPNGAGGEDEEGEEEGELELEEE